MAIKTSDLNAKLFAKADKRRATTVDEAQQAAKDKAAFIELAVAGEQTVQFELVKIQAADVAQKTCVFAQNAREQSFLNEHALADILSTLKKSGQQFPAVGRWTDDGKIEVLDGSRRRMACILAAQDFLVYVGKNISLKHAKFLSDVANAHKPLSLYERGKEMQAMLASGEVVDQKELAKVCQCSEALVSGALKAATLPRELLQAYPSVSEIGRPTVVKLHRQFFALDAEQQQALLGKLESSNELWQHVDAQGLSRITKEVTAVLETWMSDIKPLQVTKNPATELIKGKVNYVRKGNQLTIAMKQLSEAQIANILQYIESQYQ
ncbi:hypothetical protein VST7929_03291 [Vibrio stylophorae]|uniref:ParB-like N-terminal domain-containing protein n=1 Tax=Vibrio stylophorae TaxID=659351 RepID=A0ABN8DYZ4_9VIBR|nr:ParB/RepB/Spo0J family partition protein [Vibrio stylophorae]CAH0535817.1 hypothetical protein VST7929_03291 [Vibrio stylophorae]